jgi:hypothetical protein
MRQLYPLSEKMTKVYDINARYCASYAKNAIGVTLAGVAVAALLLSGCKSLFDSPPGAQDVNQDAALSAMNRLVSTTPQDVMNKGAEAARDKAGAAAGAARQHAADATAEARSGTGDESEEATVAGWEAPSLSFERVVADMPQLAVWGLDDATLLVNDEKIELGKMTRTGRIALISTGRHRLQVKCPFDPPFSADFYVQKNDRVVLRGRCSSGKRTVAGEEKRN